MTASVLHCVMLAALCNAPNLTFLHPAKKHSLALSWIGYTLQHTELGFAGLSMAALQNMPLHLAKLPQRACTVTLAATNMHTPVEWWLPACAYVGGKGEGTATKLALNENLPSGKQAPAEKAPGRALGLPPRRWRRVLIWRVGSRRRTALGTIGQTVRAVRPWTTRGSPRLALRRLPSAASR